MSVSRAPGEPVSVIRCWLSDTFWFELSLYGPTDRLTPKQFRLLRQYFDTFCEAMEPEDPAPPEAGEAMEADRQAGGGGS